MEDTTYNGWKNRETWLVNVHEFYDHEYVLEILESIAINFHTNSKFAVIAQSEELGGRERALLLALADELEEHFDDWVSDHTEYKGNGWSSLMIDLLRTAKDRIDWLAIAEGYSEEIHKESEEVYLI